MKTKPKKLQMVSLENLDGIKKKEAMRISVRRKMETVTMLRETFYGTKATTGRVQRIHSVVKLGEG